MLELDTFSITEQEILPLRWQIAAISLSSNLTSNKTITFVRKIGKKVMKLTAWKAKLLECVGKEDEEHYINSELSQSPAISNALSS